MTIETFDPKSVKTEVSDSDLARLLVGAQQLDAEDFGFTAAEIREFASVSRHPDVDWAVRCKSLGDDDLIALVKLFTLAEGAFTSWQAGGQSPVIPLAATLKERGTYPDDLTRWIKANTDNRFLPYGNLMDRL